MLVEAKKKTETSSKTGLHGLTPVEVSHFGNLSKANRVKKNKKYHNKN